MNFPLVQAGDHWNTLKVVDSLVAQLSDFHVERIYTEHSRLFITTTVNIDSPGSQRFPRCAYRDTDAE